MRTFSKSNLLISILLCAVIHNAKAQSTGPSILNSTGGSATVGTSTFEWSVAEMTVLQTATTGTLTITHGVLQPMEAQPDDTTSITEHIASHQLNVYPNPVSDFVILEAKYEGTFSLTFRLLDAAGRILLTETRTFTQHEPHKIDMKNLAVGSYYLQVHTVHAGKQYVNNFRIQKSH